MNVKKPFLLLTVFLMILSSLFTLTSPRALADTFAGDPTTKVTGWAFDSSIGGYLPTEQIKAADDPTRLAYCLQPGKSSPDHTDMPSNGQMSDKVYRILSYGYPNAAPSELGVSSKAKAHYATQMAVWIAVGEVKQSSLTYRDESIEEAVHSLLEKAEHTDDTQDIKVSVTPDHAKASIHGNHLITEPYTVKSTATGTYTVSLKNAPKQAVVTDTDGNKKDLFKTNESFKILLPKNTPTSNMEVFIDAELNQFVTMKYLSDGTYQDVVSLSSVTKHIQATAAASWETKGAIQIVKTDEDHTPLSGVAFDIKNESGEKITSVVTDDNGQAMVHDLPLGQYTAVETKTKKGFVLNPDPKTVVVHTDETSTLTFINQKVSGSVKIKKTDENGHDLKGAEFTLFRENGEKLKTAVTNEKGEAYFDNVAYGHYTVQETKTPRGFVPDATKHPLNITEHRQAVEFHIENKHIRGHAELIKVDEESPEKTLKGAVFELKNEDGALIGEYETDEDGRISVQDLAYGSYTFTEKKAPAGYVLNPEPLRFSVSKLGETVKLKASNRKITGSLELTKTDAADGNTRLKGAEFVIHNEEGAEIARGKTDENGVARFDRLPYGKYTYTETIAPKGYILNEETFAFEIKKDGQIVKHAVENHKEETNTAAPPAKKDRDTGHVEKTGGNLLPNTGNDGLYRALLIGPILLIIGLVMFVLNCKKAQNQRV
ncbi:SpaA isopeptide-forming pilin-related protein [Bacillus swezeyi]|uniref:SpaA isopeptide-forming pilin-related protein n=1 Tax=Bacillus swezeyi TaxID=1925020 RepID=UPI0027DE402C|nr:SpaA isopeptide-forming pilin-related protein [Bacillus swezeyi]